MAQLTDIEWTDMSANPIRAVRKDNGKRGHACVHASPGCIHCYSERWNGWRGTGLKFNVPSLALVDIILDQKELARMHKIKAGNKVFVCDMTDLFGPFVPDSYLDQVFGAMESNPGATWQVLTKRPERMAAYLGQRWRDGAPPHFWLGTSVENQEYADKRIPHLLRVPAQVRFLSCEPLLGPLDLSHYLIDDWTRIGDDVHWHEHPPIHWLICGGESGRSARPMQLAWARSLRDQAQAAGISYFFKQFGEYLPRSQMVPGVHCSEGEQVGQPDDSFIRVGKHAAGRLLDGREWNEVPE